MKSDADIQLNYARRMRIISRDPRDTNYTHYGNFSQDSDTPAATRKLYSMPIEWKEN